MHTVGNAVESAEAAEDAVELAAGDTDDGRKQPRGGDTETTAFGTAATVWGGLLGCEGVGTSSGTLI